MRISLYNRPYRRQRFAAVSAAALAGMGIINISGTGCAKKLPERTVPVAVYNSLADVYKKAGCIVTPWDPKNPDTLRVRMPPGATAADRDRGKAQLAVDMTRQKMGGQGRVYLFDPNGSLLVQSIPKRGPGDAP